MRKRGALAGLVGGALLACLLLSATASADVTISSPGEGAGQTKEPRGLAVASASGRLYVAERANHRIAVFDSTGQFEMAFGWGVDTGAAEPQVCTAASGCQKGIAGPGPGQFDGPTSVAVDNDPASPAFGELYVVDFDNWRVQRFDPAGEFVLSFGGGVNQSSGEDICTAASGDLCGAGGKGTGEGEFNSAFGSVIAIGVAGVQGTVYVADSRGPSSDRLSRLQRFAPSGAFLAAKDPIQAGTLRAIAIAPGGEVYVRSEAPATFCRYDSSGAIEAAFREEGCFPTEDGADVRALALGSASSLYAAGVDGAPEYRTIAQYDANGATQRRFGYETLNSGSGFQAHVLGLAPHSSAAGDIYAAQGDVVRQLSFPAAGPIPAPEACKAVVPGNIEVTLAAQINPAGKATSFRFEYVDEATYQQSGFDEAQSGETEALEVAAGEGEEFRLQPAEAAVDVIPETDYRCRVVASNEDNEAGVEGLEGEFTTLEPLEFSGVWSSDVGPEEATLSGEVNPLGVPGTNGYFEYVDEATYQQSGFDDAIRAPAAPESLDFGSGDEFETAASTLGGLEPETAYRYRLLAANPLIEPRVGPEGAFRTRPLPPEEVPDGRAYELVSPAEKASAEVGTPTNAGGGSAIRAASPDGEAATYGSFTAFADPQSAPSASQYRSRRGAEGWESENLNLFGRINGYGISYQGFTAELGFGAAVSYEPPLTEDCPAGFEDLYWRDNDSGELHCLSDEAPEVGAGTDKFCAFFSGASADGQRVIFAANGSLAGVPGGEGFSLYEWSEAEGTSPVGVLPDGTLATPKARNGFGPGYTGILECKSNAIQQNAISADGQRIFWTYDGTYKGSEKPLLARLGGSETIQLDLKEPGAAGPSGGGVFVAASRDGSVVLFTSANRLSADASGGVDLYRYDFDAGAGEELENLTPEGLTPGAEGAGVLGLLGASEDGDAAYFAANGALGPEGSPGNCSGKDISATGACDLYLWREGEGVSLVRTLDGQDEENWNPAPGVHSARVSPDGRHLAFVSRADLSGYDSKVAGAGGCDPDGAGGLSGKDPRCPQVYLYDSTAQSLHCASCNPTGERPTGPSALPGWTNPFSGPRYLSAGGGRLFFTSRDALSGSDRNDAQDVYEFERPATGSCTTASKAYVASSGGCLYLISGGESEGPSYLLDASSDGRDVFISTRERLVESWDIDERYDVYDYREGGGFPDKPPPEICAAEAACRAPAPQPPVALAPGTPGFHGPGNLKARPDCTTPARRAAKQRQRARRLARGAKRAANRRRGAKMRRRAKRLDVRAKRIVGKARRCRRANREARG